MPEPIEEFTAHRGLLFTIAYEMLGSAADAEDVLQESWLRWSEVDHESVRDSRAYLVRIVTRQSLNRLRSLKRQRESYVGPWLPEPLITAPDVADDVELADSVSFAMLVVLETLTPLERAVFVLHDVFGFGYDEVAESTGRSTAAVRQIAHRARNHVQARRPRVADPPDSEDVARRFLVAAASGDLQQLLEVLAPDVVLLADGGGKMRAALRPILGSDKVARFLHATRPEGAELEIRWTSANGGPGALLYLNGVLDSVVGIQVAGGQVAELYFVRNPDKLAHLTVEKLTRH